MTRRVVTFGGSHNPIKLTDPVIETWAKILRRTPGSRLLLRYVGLEDPVVRQRFLDMFEKFAVEPTRIGLAGRISRSELFDWYQNIDVALEPFPYSGGVTTCDALWMGLPVVALPGETFAGRHSYSYLSNVNMQELAARDLDDYIEIAVSLAKDPDRLSQLRGCLRDRVRINLCDGRRSAEELTAALRRTWRDWCQTSQ